MKTPLIFLTFIFLILASCVNSPKHEKQQADIPKALQENNSSRDFSRPSGDLIDKLYAEQVNNTPELKQLENTIQDLSKNQDDSMESFENFNTLNKLYYDHAKLHTNRFTDSVLREKIKMLIANSLANYNSIVSPHNDIIKLIEKKKTTLNDLHIALIIVKTLPVIAQYQKDHLPSTKPLADISKQQDAVIYKANTLLKN